MGRSFDDSPAGQEQVARFGRSGEVPSQHESGRFSFLDDADRVLAGRHREEHNRLDLNLQLANGAVNRGSPDAGSEPYPPSLPAR
ncbi:hypothetical protein WJ438_23395 [Streptomyces sp. GD-15H]|uniref:hypothetical protein n=1 Tax=Streptomyces sp. GD-15H TaxID=3129112 RepID=UPI003251218F